MKLMHFRDCQWSDSDGDIAGKPAWLRRNESLETVNRADFPTLVIVNLILDYVDDEGLPVREENELAGDFEELLGDLFETRYGGLFAIALTCDKTRDLFFFVPKPIDEESLEAAIRELTPPLDFDFGIHDAENWKLYDNFA